MKIVRYAGSPRQVGCPKKPHSTVPLTQAGREAFTEYRENLLGIIQDLPE